MSERVKEITKLAEESSVDNCIEINKHFSWAVSSSENLYKFSEIADIVEKDMEKMSEGKWDWQKEFNATITRKEFFSIFDKLSNLMHIELVDAGVNSCMDLKSHMLLSLK